MWVGWLGCAAALLVWGAGCAHTVPLLAGGRATPSGRTDLAAGGAARVPLGALADAQHPGGGMSPVLALRHGIADHLDVGLIAAGSTGRADLRYELVLSDAAVQARAWVAVAPVAGIDDAGRPTVGAELPFGFGLDASSLLLFWAGLRPGVMRAPAGDDGAHSTTLSLGAVIGLGFGFRHLHALVELSVGYEHRPGDAQDGWMLAPGFVLRLRV